VGAAAFVVGVREAVLRDFPGCVATVGRLAFEPGAFNVIPGRARVALEFRSLDAAQLDALEDELLALAGRVSDVHGLALDVELAGRWEPTPLDDDVRAAVARAAAALELSALDLPSGAGHDAQALARVTRSGMLFVPSAGGLSHQPGEHTAWEDCVNGANVLLGAALELAAA
jgi:N-carbamoyl-L-amino-acid hydrolase